MGLVFPALLSTGLAVENNGQDGPKKSDETTSVIHWTTAEKLMPGWGLYHFSERGESGKSLGKYAVFAIGEKGILTWVENFPKTGIYQIYVRHARSSGKIKVFIDETPAEESTTARNDADKQGHSYQWEHIGAASITKGSHHVDIQIAGIFDAVLFTTQSGFDPANAALPPPNENPTVREPRKYRDDSPLEKAAGQQGFVTAVVPPYLEMLNDHVPTPEQLVDRIHLWGAASQYVDGNFVIRALQATQPLDISLNELTGPESFKILAPDIDLRVVHLRRRILTLFESFIPKVILPDILLRDDRTNLPPKGEQGGYGGGICITAIPAHESRQIWITVHIPSQAPPGVYKGTIELQVANESARKKSLPIEIEVLPINLEPVKGYYSVFYRSHPGDPKETASVGSYIEPSRYLEELQDQVRHGVNTTTLFGDFSSIRHAKEAGMTEAPCLITMNTNPDQVAAAKALGFPDLYFCGVDEPKGEKIEVCRKEGERRLNEGTHMFTAINSVLAWEGTKDAIDRPVYNLNVFSGPDNPVAMYAREKGFIPVSYWTTGGSYPLYFRAATGLYNRRCGYYGTVPWGFQDFPDDRVYVEDDSMHAVSYPDEKGRPIPSLNWEAYRAGIDDVRYLQALDRAIQSAEETANASRELKQALDKARLVRKERYENIQGKIAHYISKLEPEVLDESRREIAEAIMAIQQNLSSK